MTREEIHAWLLEKLSEAEKALGAREQAEAVWRGGTDESWARAGMLHPDTARGPRFNKEQRIKLSESQGRIAEKCRHEVKMFKAVLELLTPNP